MLLLGIYCEAQVVPGILCFFHSGDHLVYMKKELKKTGWPFVMYEEKDNKKMRLQVKNVPTNTFLSFVLFVSAGTSSPDLKVSSGLFIAPSIKYPSEQ